MPDLKTVIADVLIVTVTPVESRAVLQAFQKFTGNKAQSTTIGDRVYRDLGTVNGAKVFMAFSEMGAVGLGAALQTVQKGITALHPHAVIMVGIAFGVDEQKQAIGDILVSKQLMFYDAQKVVSGEIVPRGDRPHSASRLIDYLYNAHLDWDGAEVRFGLVLTGEKLVDDLDYRESLKKLESEAIGGEMEGAGLYASCHDAKVDWILVKAICDWADGNKGHDKKQRQQQAAENAAAFVLYALQHASLLRLTPLPNSAGSGETQQVARQITAANYIEGDVNGGNIAGRDIIIHQTTAQLDTDWNRHPNISSLVCANLLGAWDENNEADIKILRELLNEDYDVWIVKIREVLHYPNSPVSLANGLWQVTDRKALWKALGSKLFDIDLERFKQCAISVLTERDPQFDLPVNDRYAAVIYKKVLSHSHNLRQGIAESLALLGNESGVLTHCSRNKRESIAVLVIRDLFATADWLLWGSLDKLLPILAEAAPNEFLNAVDEALAQSPCPFEELFLQEGDGFAGRNYLTGLLWALESLAWDKTYLVRACVIFAELAAHDPGGRGTNRPANSLTTILLSWCPQTTAPVEKRIVALKKLQKEFPAVAWKLLLSLLPNQQQISMGTHKPTWRNTIPDDWEKGDSSQNSWTFVSSCAELAVSMASNDIEKLTELAAHLDKLPAPAFEKILEHLSSATICDKPEDERSVLWDKLIGFVARHRRLSNAEWALAPGLLLKIELAAKNIAPKNPLNLHRRLFSNRDYDLYEENGNYAEQRQKLGERREQAIKDILTDTGIDAVINFAESVESPLHVGLSLGVIAGTEIDKAMLPAFLETDNNKLTQLAGGYVSSKQYKYGWEWVDGLDKSDWTFAQIAQFLNYLPFSKGTWSRSATLLGESEREYWYKANVYPYQPDCDMGIAIDKLIEYGRPHAAIDCLQNMLYDQRTLDKSRSIKALLAAVSSEEPPYTMDAYRICEIIKALQDDADTAPEDIFRIEWTYLPLLDDYHGASPKFLESRLATEPEFFCELIRLVYRSTNADEAQKEPSEQDKNVASNVYRLLQKWRTPPGTQPDGSFSGEQFTYWLKQTKQSCSESGHLDIALNRIGKVLFYCPPDPQGLWIDHAAADALNARDAKKMREGLSDAIFYPGGTRSVDPSGQEQRQLSQKYRKQADEVEDSGYQRLATTLRELAEDYDLDAERNVDEHKR